MCPTATTCTTSGKVCALRVGVLPVLPCCAQVRGYLPLDLDVAPGVAAEVDFSEQQAAVAELAQRKQELMYELASYQNSRTQAAVPVRGEAGRGAAGGGLMAGITGCQKQRRRKRRV